MLFFTHVRIVCIHDGVFRCVLVDLSNPDLCQRISYKELKKGSLRDVPQSNCRRPPGAAQRPDVTPGLEVGDQVEVNYKSKGSWLPGRVDWVGVGLAGERICHVTLDVGSLVDLYEGG